MIYYITGGERSGKSSYAQKLALELSESPYYIATSRIWDDDFKKRVDRHIQERDERWTTIQEEKHLGNLEISGEVAVIDCITLWLTNLYFDNKNDIEKALQQGKEELIRLFKKEATVIIISNEIGMGVHAQTEVGRKFTELQGCINQFIATKSDKAILMVSGLPVSLK
ncbi:MAG: bifunctional adenosylcobinamide kinase/adenosylcobinamide-phosphate guanylyltransferase [Vicingus serpentipes]|nr:bifunctional adenosylcobinamide kinase/adenosylcobinamide-phosphate guanylyltransferase [Vicingus serpentipes]